MSLASLLASQIVQLFRIKISGLLWTLTVDNMDSIQGHPGGLESNTPEDHLMQEHSGQSAPDQQTGKDPLTRLPVELQNMSFQSLNVFDKLNLKFVNKYFHAFIPPYSLADYLKVEKLPGAKGKFYFCGVCSRLRPREKFADNSRIQGKAVSHLSACCFSRPQVMSCSCMTMDVEIIKYFRECQN